MTGNHNAGNLFSIRAQRFCRFIFNPYNMRCLLMPLLIAAIACSSPKMAVCQDWPLNGVWIPVSLEIAGKPLPPASFANQLLELADSYYLFVAESEDRGIVRYAPVNQMDIYGREGVNKGKHFSAIYKLGSSY